MKALLMTVTMIAALTCVGMASDGVIEINQARALAGGVTPSDTPGFPVTIDSPGSYRLTGNLNAGNTVGAIVVTASHVTIDLNGFALSGGQAGITGDPKADDITVKDGVIRSQNAGVILLGRGHHVDRVRVSDSWLGITVGDGLISNCTVRNSTYGLTFYVSGLATGNSVANSHIALGGNPFGFASPDTFGYSNNALTGNVYNVLTGVSLGANLCDNKLCQ